jgi:3-oxoacyl-[acyl-carrier-protein] synthase-3
LGLRGIVIKSHGGADVDSFFQAIKEAYLETQVKITEKIATQVSKMIKSSSVALIPDIFNALLAAMSAKSQVDSLVTMRLSLIPVREVIHSSEVSSVLDKSSLQSVCAGFVFALTTAEQYIKTGAANKVLVVGSETLSRIVDWKDRSTAISYYRLLVYLVLRRIGG